MTGRIGVLGAGGMGSAFAGFLARAGHDVVLIGRGSPHIRAVTRNGLVVDPPDADPWTVPLECAVTAEELRPTSLDLLLVLTKSFDTTEALEAAQHGLRDDGVAVSPQNGLGCDTLLSEVVGVRRTLVGVTTVGATLGEPGRITVSGSTATGSSMTHVGTTARAGGGQREQQLVDLLCSAALPAAVSPDIERRIWEKLALASMSPLSAVLQRTVSDVWSTAGGRELVRGLFDEVVMVAAAEGVELEADAAWTHASRVYADTGEHMTSLATDVALGRRTEISSMSGAVHRLGAAAGVPVPAHTTVLAMLDVVGAR